jgi:hypothetical protein
MSSGKTKGTVISRRNAGFGDNLFAAAHAWYYAKKSNRKLVVSWAPSMYLDDKSINAFGFFFDFPDEIEGVPIIAKKRVGSISRLVRSLPLEPRNLFIPSVLAEVSKRVLKNKTPEYLKKVAERRVEWVREIITNGKEVHKKSLILNGCYGFLKEETKPFFREIKLKPEYQKKLEDFSAQHFEGKKVIGVQIRYYDKNLPPNNHTKYWLEPEESLKIINQNLKKIVDDLDDPNYIIFLATDNKMVHDSIRSEFNQVVTYEKNFDIVQIGMHLHLPVESAFNGLVEMFLLAKSDVLYRFPPSGSWFSHYGSIYAKKVV